MIATELPLFELFDQLRRQRDLPLGVDDYILFLRALQAGFGREDPQALKRLCCTLWAKSESDVRLFDRLYQQMLEKITVPSSGSPQAELRRNVPEKPFVPGSETQTDEPSQQPDQQQLTTQFSMDVDDPAQVVQAIRHKLVSDEGVANPRFNLLTDYFPVTRRQMKQSWRHLRRMVREGPLEELDVAATVDQAARSWVITELVLLPTRLNRADLVLMIDQDGSMVAFQALTRQLVDTAYRGGRLGQTGVHYFHDYPDCYLYRDPARLEAQPVSEALKTISEQALVMIISDAGAARGHYDPLRIQKTAEFIQQLKQFARRYVWLNPMPRDRWQDNSAADIANLLPMFEMNRSGLDAAINALRGRYFYSTVKM